MFKTTIFILSLFAATQAFAQHAGFTPLANTASFKSAFTQAAQKTQSIKSDFVQEKNLGMLAEKIVSKGKFWFKRESQVRMEYNQPYQYLMILNKDKIFIKDGQKENKISAKSNKLFQQINRIMIDCMQGTALDNPDFKTRIFGNKTNSLIELTPQTKGLKEMFKTINVIVDSKDFSVISIEMLELSNDNTLIRFTNKELNAEIPNSLFIIL